MTFIQKNIFTLALLLFCLVPAPSFAQSEPESVGGLVPCGNERAPLVEVGGQQTGGEVKNPCNFYHFLEMVSRVVKFILFKLLVPFAAVMIAYAGFLLVFSGGSQEKRTKAKDILLSVLIGMGFAIGAWIIIHTILSILGYDGSWVGL